MNLREHSDEELLSGVAKLVGSHREITARLVAHLAEIEDRRLHLLAGFSSMFEFCTKEHRMGEGEAFRRILAARLGRRFPVVYDLLASGSVNLSTLELLREWMTAENHAELLAAVAGKGKREVQVLLAKRFPRPDRPATVRHVRVEVLSEARFAVEFTASEALREKLERCRDLMSHSNPNGDLAVVIERAVDLLLVDLERKRLARTKRAPRPRDVRERGSSGIKRATRREVFQRDGFRCTYVAENGRRCESRAFLELDHAVPKALGGSDVVENLRVRCRAHNRLWAEQVFGRERVDRARDLCQQKSIAGGESKPPMAPALEKHGEHGVAAQAPFEKVRLALRAMGFRDGEARKAVTRLMATQDPNEPMALDRALREAVLIATAA